MDAHPRQEPHDRGLRDFHNLAMCRPTAWRRSGKSVPGMITGFASNDGTRGAFLFRYHFPRGIIDRKALAAVYLRRSFAALFPSEPNFDQAPDNAFFMELTDSTKAWYRYAGGEIYAAAGVHRTDGAVVVGLVYGPSPYLDEDEPCRIFESFMVYETY